MRAHPQGLLIVLTGPTATGKTRLAVRLALELDGEIISADSRQVYRGMDLGTGKDLEDYRVGDRFIPYHLVDIAEPGSEYNLFSFQQDFRRAFDDITSRKKQAVLCGGSGMYIEAAITSYPLRFVPHNPSLRRELEAQSMEQLVQRLSQLKKLHNTTDITDRLRLLRAIEIAEHERQHAGSGEEVSPLQHVVFAIHREREALRQRITQRLKERLEMGMLREVQRLMDEGVSPEKLHYYGLEYRYLSSHLRGHLTYNEMFTKLNTAIHQFAKRQMTWFRRMERKGIAIHWLPGDRPVEEQMELLFHHLDKTKG